MLFLSMVAVSAGRFSGVRAGDEEHQVCVVFGPAVDEIWSAEELAEPAQIILSPKAWRLCDRKNLTVEHIENEEAVKIGPKPCLTDMSDTPFLNSLLLNWHQF